MRHVTEIVWHVDSLRGLGQWLTLLSVMLSGPAFAVGASGIAMAELEDGSATGPRTPPAGEYWVSPTGNDTGPGTEERPFATPQRARDALREARKGGLP